MFTSKLIPFWSECCAECVIYNSAGSVFLVAFSTPEQRGGNWYAHLVPQSRARTIARCPAKSQVVSFLERAGFDVVALQKWVHKDAGNFSHF